MEAGWFKLDFYRGFFCLLSIIIFLGLSRWNITDGFEQTLMVEPRYPFQGGQFHRRLCLPGRTSVYQFGFVQAVDGFSQGIVELPPRLPTEGSMPAPDTKESEAIFDRVKAWLLLFED